MRILKHHLLTVLLAVAGSAAAAGDRSQPALPAVLIIGDDVYQQFAAGITSELKGHAKVVIPKWPANVLPNSSNAIEHLDLLLGYKAAAGNDVPEAKRPDWKLIYLNVGLGDLIHRVPGLKSHRSLPWDFGGVITTPPEQYEKNLETLIQLIKSKAPKVKIVWASTTPIPETTEKWFRAGSEIEYNQIAERVMKKNGISINDMHSYVTDMLKDAKPAFSDPFNFAKKPLYPPVVKCILREM